MSTNILLFLSTYFRHFLYTKVFEVVFLIAIALLRKLFLRSATNINIQLFMEKLCSDVAEISLLSSSSVIENSTSFLNSIMDKADNLTKMFD